MTPWILTFLTVPIYFTSAIDSEPSWGLENEALIVKCPNNVQSLYPVEWYHSTTNQRISTQKGNRVFASGELLKFLPAKVNDSGIYTCIIRSPTLSNIRYANVTIYKRQPDCRIPDDFIYSTVHGSEKNAKIHCPNAEFYNWTAPLVWFKGCKALQGPRYVTHRAYLAIDNVTSDDAGDYTCKLLHSENGVHYPVTATRSFIVKEKQGFSMFPVILAPPPNETKEVKIGETANLTCYACFGKGPQFLVHVLWEVNGSNVRDFGEARIREEEGPNESSSNEMTCRNKLLRITDVNETDLSLQFDCVALNHYVIKRHTTRLSRKKPTNYQSTYHLVAGGSILLVLIIVLVIILKVFWIEVILLWRDTVRPYKTRNDGKLYDAYVIYPHDYQQSSEEISSVEHFVHQIMPNVLEDKCGYKLCIYGRDLLPGEDAVTAVESSICKSRRHIFILSPVIVHSKEFAYEQEIALHSTLIQNDSKAILIEMEALSEPDALQDSLKHLMEVQGTIKWREDNAANKWSLKSKFWKHVRYQMPVPHKLPR
ncbi:interleukin-1 receptor-like 1 [Lepus europaeus]|uniref:interleukin-1 receptor-like 1 n=1 Tax=Lepus europaeus TaxID=9983 RepID=UPI002B49B49A|nr:interleukin-1 receptor-like 1 [Lepus europaeus]